MFPYIDNRKLDRPQTFCVDYFPHCIARCETRSSCQISLPEVFELLPPVYYQLRWFNTMRWKHICAVLVLALQLHHQGALASKYTYAMFIDA